MEDLKRCVHYVRLDQGLHESKLMTITQTDLNYLTLSQISPCTHVCAVQVFSKHCGKRRNCSLRAISPFPTVFSTILIK